MLCEEMNDEKAHKIEQKNISPINPLQHSLSILGWIPSLVCQPHIKLFDGLKAAAWLIDKTKACIPMF